MRTKYVFVTGGVMSGLGKGVTTAAMAKILQVRGFQVSAMKIDPYLNVDAGTMNPIVHGEVFVTEDGGEMDMDLGTYERFLSINLTKAHNVTTGQVYRAVIEKERRGDFLGQCVQIIPHVTDEIKSTIREVASKSGPDVMLVEIGGTVGDIESLPFLEAARQMRLDEGAANVVYVHVTLVPVLDVVGEPKTKPTQHSVQELRRIGIQPDIIVARSKTSLSSEPKRKIALFCNVESRAVFSSPDVKTIYSVPIIMDEQGMGTLLSEKLALDVRGYDWGVWRKIVESLSGSSHLVKIAVCGKYADLADSYVSVNEALRHAAANCNARVEIEWVETERFENSPAECSILDKFDGVLVPGGFGSRGVEGKIAALKYARENDIPLLGICFGFQLAVVEFARSLGLSDANSTEINPNTAHPVVSLMPEQQRVNLKGATMRLGASAIQITPNTVASALYGRSEVMERHRHRFEVNPLYIEQLESGGGLFSGRSDNGERMEMFELPENSYHVGTQFHGEFKSRPGAPSPPYLGLIKAALNRKLNEAQTVMSD